MATRKRRRRRKAAAVAAGVTSGHGGWHRGVGPSAEREVPDDIHFLISKKLLGAYDGDLDHGKWDPLSFSLLGCPCCCGRTAAKVEALLCSLCIFMVQLTVVMTIQDRLGSYFAPCLASDECTLDSFCTITPHPRSDVTAAQGMCASCPYVPNSTDTLCKMNAAGSRVNNGTTLTAVYQEMWPMGWLVDLSDADLEEMCGRCYNSRSPGGSTPVAGFTSLAFANMDSIGIGSFIVYLSVVLLAGQLVLKEVEERFLTVLFLIKQRPSRDMLRGTAQTMVGDKTAREITDLKKMVASLQAKLQAQSFRAGGVGSGGSGLLSTGSERFSGGPDQKQNASRGDTDMTQHHQEDSIEGNDHEGCTHIGLSRNDSITVHVMLGVQFARLSIAYTMMQQLPRFLLFDDGQGPIPILLNLVALLTFLDLNGLVLHSIHADQVQYLNASPLHISRREKNFVQWNRAIFWGSYIAVTCWPVFFKDHPTNVTDAVPVAAFSAMVCFLHMALDLCLPDTHCFRATMFIAYAISVSLGVIYSQFLFLGYLSLSPFF